MSNTWLFCKKCLKKVNECECVNKVPVDNKSKFDFNGMHFTPPVEEVYFPPKTSKINLRDYIKDIIDNPDIEIKDINIHQYETCTSITIEIENEEEKKL